ncbi:MAG: hypothetical protein JW940_28415 [Polyangiaceae bacterium]|nr:hypothetical protein [Polyangiaceae bacterium]
MTGSLERRAREVRQRRLVLTWEYRQRELAKGVWFRLRRVLADAQSAWAVDDADAQALLANGAEPIAVGQELEPRKRIFWVPSTRLENLASRRELSVRLSSELLATPNLVLVRYGG